MINFFKKIGKFIFSNREDKVPEFLYHVTYFIKKGDQPYWAQVSLFEPPSLEKDNPYLKEILKQICKKWDLKSYDSYGLHIDVEWKNESVDEQKEVPENK